MLSTDRRTFDLYSDLRILRLNDRRDMRKLLFLLSGTYYPIGLTMLDNDAYFDTFESELELPARHIAELVTPGNPNGIGAHTAIVEQNYVDRDSNVAYTYLHARSFRDHPRRTIRVHFFRLPDDGEPITFNDLLNEAWLQPAYLGFCVVPSTEFGPLGRTVLSPRDETSSPFAVPCVSGFSVNLAGAKLIASGTAFIQQDGHVAACATAAMWMSTMIAARRYRLDMSMPSMAEITSLATRHSLPQGGRGTSPGLSIPQILWGLHEMGYEPAVYNPRTPETAAAVISAYVQSGIPPILIFGLSASDDYHAVAAVGYRRAPDAGKQSVAKGVTNLGERRAQFLVNDDQVGAYIPLTFPSRNRSGLTVEIDPKHPMILLHRDEIPQWYRRGAWLKTIIVPMPPRHSLSLTRATINGLVLIDKAYELYTAFSGPKPERLVSRTYFIASNEFKRRSFERTTGISPTLAALYRGASYSRYIWVVELCSVTWNAAIDHEELRVVADVTIDPTAAAPAADTAPPTDFITLHIPRIFLKMAHNESNLENALNNSTEIVDDTPYLINEQPL